MNYIIIVCMLAIAMLFSIIVNLFIDKKITQEHGDEDSE